MGAEIVVAMAFPDNRRGPVYKVYEPGLVEGLARLLVGQTPVPSCLTYASSGSFDAERVRGVAISSLALMKSKESHDCAQVLGVDERCNLEDLSSLLRVYASSRVLAEHPILDKPQVKEVARCGRRFVVHSQPPIGSVLTAVSVLEHALLDGLSRAYKTVDVAYARMRAVLADSEVSFVPAPAVQNRWAELGVGMRLAVAPKLIPYLMPFYVDHLRSRSKQATA